MNMVTCDEPNVRSNSRYSINETCVLLGITRKTLAKYTRDGLIQCGFKPDLRKFYTGVAILKFWRAAM